MKTLTYEYVDKLLTKKGFKLIKVVENDFEDTDYLEINYIYQKGTVKLDINTCDDEVVFIMISDKHNHHQSLRLDKFDEYIRYNLLDSFEESKKTVRKSIKESKTNYLTVEEFCNLCAKIFIHYEIWSFDGHNRYEESYDLSRIKSCPYKKYDVLMWDVQNDVLILYIENNAIPF